MANSDLDPYDTIIEFMKEYCNIVFGGLDERWKKFDIKIYDSENYEVVGGLLARQATLTTRLASSPQLWDSHIAPLILRSMIDAHITLAWILQNLEERAKKYILYGLGQEKLLIEHLKIKNEEEKENEALSTTIEEKEAWLNSQRQDFLTEVNIGSWSGLSTRSMAIEANCKELYDFSYTSFSSATHNMWQHISTHNLIQCNNPLHKYHKVPGMLETYINPDFVCLSAKYIEISYNLFDDVFCINPETPMPLAWYIHEFENLGNTNAEHE